MPYKSPEARKAYNRDLQRRKRLARKAGRKSALPARPLLEPSSVADWPANVGTVLATWASENLVTPEGPRRGRAFVLQPWQVDFLNDAGRTGIDVAVASTARRNGKSGLISSLLCAMLTDSPLYIPGASVLATSLTGALAGELRSHTVRMLTASGLMRGIEERKSPPPGTLTSSDGSVSVRFLNATRSTGTGLAADLAVVDEVGVLADNYRGLISNMTAATTGRNGKVVHISIQGSSEMMRELIERSGDPDIVVHLHAAADDVALDDEEALTSANPSCASGLVDLPKLKRLARLAKHNPGDALEFRRLHLNQRVSEFSATAIVAVEDWARCEVGDSPPKEGPCYVGVDLGLTSSMSALAAYWPDVGRLDAWAGVAAVPALQERGEIDGVGARYVSMFEEGTLWHSPGATRTVDNVDFLRWAFDRVGYDVALVVGDRYRQSELLDALDAVGLRCEVEYRGQGWKDGAEDVREFQRAVLSERLRVRTSLLMTSAISESTLAIDAAGNAKLQRARRRGRIDALSAAVMAVSAGERARSAVSESGMSFMVIG